MVGQNRYYCDAVTKYSPNYSTYKAEIFTPAFRGPAVEKRLQRDLGLRVETVITEEAVIR